MSHHTIILYTIDKEKKVKGEEVKLTIKFTGDYPKLWNQNSAKLIRVELLPFNPDTMKDLLEYDTKHTDGSYYKLPKGDYLQLFFIGDKHIPFCTIRRFTQVKADYYLHNIGQWFEVIRL
jgi:hypothetical protein